jgi:anti-sigma regulatory factor (Ser/Thr protein kinase)
LVEQRRSESPFDQRRVKVDIVLTPQSIRITLRDNGDGFDVDHVPAAGAMETGDGRGLVLMKTFMDEVEFADEGRQVTMVKYKA